MGLYVTHLKPDEISFLSVEFVDFLFTTNPNLRKDKKNRDELRRKVFEALMRGVILSGPRSHGDVVAMIGLIKKYQQAAGATQGEVNLLLTYSIGNGWGSYLSTLRQVSTGWSNPPIQILKNMNHYLASVRAQLAATSTVEANLLDTFLKFLGGPESFPTNIQTSKQALEFHNKMLSAFQRACRDQRVIKLRDRYLIIGVAPRTDYMSCMIQEPTSYMYI